MHGQPIATVRNARTRGQPTRTASPDPARVQPARTTVHVSTHIRPSTYLSQPPTPQSRTALDDQRPVTLEARRSASQGILSPRGEGFQSFGAGLAKGWAGRVPGIRQNSELSARNLRTRKPKLKSFGARHVCTRSTERASCRPRAPELYLVLRAKKRLVCLARTRTRTRTRICTLAPYISHPRDKRTTTTPHRKRSTMPPARA